MDDKLKLSLDLYDNLLRVDLDIKKYLDIDTFSLIEYKRYIIDFFNNKYNNLDSSNVDDIKNSYFDCLSIYSQSIFNNLKEIKNVDILTEAEKDYVFQFNVLIMTIIDDNVLDDINKEREM